MIRFLVNNQPDAQLFSMYLKLFIFKLFSIIIIKLLLLLIILLLLLIILLLLLIILLLLLLLYENYFQCIYFSFLHVSSNLVFIIRRNNRINTTSGICHSVSVTVSFAVHPAQETVTDPE